MSKSAIIQKIEKRHMKENAPKFSVGDTVKVHIRIREGDKERVQVYQGTVIAKKGTALGESFSVHRIAYGVGMERVFYLHSPNVIKVEVMKRGRVRRAKLYYLRNKYGKAARVKTLITRKAAPAA